MKKNKNTNVTPFTKSKFRNALELNNSTFNDFYFRLKLLALNLLKWENLPLTVDSRFLNLLLFEEGSALYFHDEIIGDIITQYTGYGLFNLYREPSKRHAFGENGYQRFLSANNSIIIYENYLRLPMQETIKLYANRLYEIQRAIDVNVKTQKFPMLILTNENKQLSMKNLYQQYDGNEPIIYGDEKMMMSDVKCINTGSPYVADKLMVLLHNTWNDALTFLGIENSNADKKERLVADEVGSNNGAVEMNRNARLDSIRLAVDKINIKFNQNIKVSYNSQLVSNVNNRLPLFGGVGNE